MESKQISFEQVETIQSRNNLECNRHFGNTLVLKWRADGEPKYVIGPHFILFICTLVITTLLQIAMGVSMISNAIDSKFLMTLGIIFGIGFYSYSYLKVGFSNPGLASQSQELSQQQRNNLRYCVPCKIIRPLGTVHCYSCDICIHGYDHHCPWVGKCVGRDNLCAFKTFIFSVVLLLSIFGICAANQKTTNIGTV